MGDPPGPWPGRGLARPGTGALSHALDASGEPERWRAHSAFAELLAEIGLLSLRRLVPATAALPGQLNLLTAEAVSVAEALRQCPSAPTVYPRALVIAESLSREAGCDSGARLHRAVVMLLRFG